MTIFDNEQILRWIAASVNDYFKTIADTNSIPIYVDGAEPDFENQQQLIEVRITGVRPSEKVVDNWHCELDLHLMCSCKLGPNAYTIYDLVGKFQNAVQQPIPVYQYDGTTPAPYLECFQLRRDLDNPVDVIPWGLVQVNTGPLRVLQTSIESHHKLVL